jgi:hypothetical protein
MANYRQLHTRTWSDSWFLGLTNVQKLLFIYLFSNPRASVTGLYELPLKLIRLETGLGCAAILRALEVYAAADKVYYDAQAEVVWVVSMPKYQLGERINLTLQKRIEADIRAVPECGLKQRFFEKEQRWAMGHACPIDGVNSISFQSQSESQSESQSQLGEALQTVKKEAAGEEQKPPPTTPLEAARDPDIVIFSEVTGRWPGVSQYPLVIDALRFIREKRNLTYEMAISYLVPYWLAWSGRRRQDGRNYDPSNLTWLTEWAVNGQIPSQAAAPADGKASPSQAAEAIRQVAERHK